MQIPVFLVMVNISDEVWSHRITERRKLVGRSKVADIRILPHYETISRCHAEVWSDAGGIWLKDLGSLCGTQVNGICVEEETPVRIMLDDRIALSDIEFKLVENLSPLATLLDEINVTTNFGDDDASRTELNGLHFETVEARSRLSELTPAELEIVLWMYRGYTSDAELGSTLYRSPHTIRTQVASIFDKLGVRSRTEIVTWIKRIKGSSRMKHKDKQVGRDTRTW